MGDTKIRRMFLQEARLSAILNHPHIVQTFDFGEVDGAPYMAMELVDGVNVSQLCRALAKEERWIPLRASVEICTAVADALEYAHNLKDLDSGKPLNLVHRDVSPQNILLSRQGGVKLADFGIARHDARDEHTIGISSKGKPGYMAPEQSVSNELDGRADLFALGIVLTELVSARRVMKTPAQLLHLRERITELFEMRDDVPSGLLELALSMTALEPKDRPKSAREVAIELRHLATQIPQKPSLSAFLEKVFTKYFPSDPMAAAAKEKEKSLEFESDPVAGEKTLPDQNDWNKKEEPNPAASVFGWPAEYLEKPKEPLNLDLVSRSSSVDAMKFFGAQGTSKEAPAPVPAPAPEPAPRVIFGSPLSDRPPASQQLLPGLPKAMLGLPGESDGDAAKKLERQQLLRRFGLLAAAGAIVAALGFGAIVLFSKIGKKEESRELRIRGTIVVTSVPPGATVIVDGHDTKQKTPATLENLPLDRPVALRVRLDGYVAVPAEATIDIPDDEKKTNAYFVLKRGRVFQIETTPEGASVEVNGRLVSGVTPVTLPAVPFGESATVAILLDGYLPYRTVLRSIAETATVTAATLELGKEVDIVSEPPGARVFVDGVERGLTPAYDLLVPTARKFRVKVDKKGYKPWKQTLSAKQLKERLIEADLVSMPLLAMPMSKEDLREAKEWDRKVSKLNQAMRGAKAKLSAAEKKLEQVEAQPNIFIGRIADAQRAVDEWRGRIEEIDTEMAEVDGHVQAFRDRVMAKLEE